MDDEIVLKLGHVEVKPYSPAPNDRVDSNNRAGYKVIQFC